MNQEATPGGEASTFKNKALNLLQTIMQSLRFYSRLPIPPLAFERDAFAAPDFHLMPLALPFAGAMIGAVGGLVLGIALLLNFGSLVSAGLAIAALTFATGAFHEDGLADTSDGFGGGSTVERRLVIMRDSLIGSFGGSALALAFILRVAALSEISGRLPLAASVGLVVITAFLSRISALYVLVALPSARSDGLSRTMGRTSWRNYGSGLALSWILALVLGLIVDLPIPSILLMIPAPLLVSMAMARFSKRMIGGQTGDVAGASQQIGEIAVFLAVLGAS